jgi:catechol 2,3-dioxygenase
MGGQGRDASSPGALWSLSLRLLYPSRRELAVALKRLMDAGYPLTGMSDHGVSEALYLDDPDMIGVELYADRPRSEWKVKNDGEVEMVTRPLDVESLLAELES